MWPKGQHKENIMDPLTKSLSKELVNNSSKEIGLKPLNNDNHT
jgi:hypothetical protein